MNTLCLYEMNYFDYELWVLRLNVGLKIVILVQLEECCQI